MDWSIQPFSKKSTASGERFEAGETVVSFLYKDEAGVLQRMDLKQEELPHSALPARVLGRWTHAVKAKDEGAQEKQAHLESAEALFLSFFEAGSEDAAGSQEDVDTPAAPAGSDQDKALLQLILALMLERKRILKPLDGAEKAESRRYIHVRSQMTYTVPVVAYQAEDLVRIQERLKTLF